MYALPILSLVQAQKKKHQPKQTSLAPPTPSKGPEVISPSPPTPAPASSAPPSAAGHNIGSENSSMFDVQNASFPGVSMGSMPGSNSNTNLKCVGWYLIPILLCLCVFLLRLFRYL